MSATPTVKPGAGKELTAEEPIASRQDRAQ
ncbi:unnamed protein product, partial [Rotaria sordida]